MIPVDWMPRGDVRRTVLHWTAGTHKPSALERLHYHFLIDGSGTVWQGARDPGKYLPHTRGLNTGSIGIALCGMAGAFELPFIPGRYPLLPVQFSRATELVRQLVQRYDLVYTERSVLVHADVGRVYGIPQKGKWDITCWPGEGGRLVPVTAAEASHRFRLFARNGQ
jgi:hypothetical protein